MKVIGLVGGMSPESTKDYYEILIGLARDRLEGDLNNPEIVIYSINLSKMFAMLKAQRHSDVVDMLSDVVERLRLAGADLAALTANTPHIYFEEIKGRARLPLVSILDVTFERAKALGCKKALLLGTRFTMQSDMYPNLFSKGGIEIVVPDADEQAFVHGSIAGELVKGVVTSATRQRYIETCRKHIGSGVDAVILGCTEIPMVLKDGDLDVAILNTTMIHAEAIFDLAMEDG